MRLLPVCLGLLLLVACDDEPRPISGFAVHVQMLEDNAGIGERLLLDYQRAGCRLDVAQRHEEAGRILEILPERRVPNVLTLTVRISAVGVEGPPVFERCYDIPDSLPLSQCSGAVSIVFTPDE